MLSHLRFHRRAPSTPSSPVPDQQLTWETAAIHEHPQTVHDVSPRPEIRPRSSTAQMPPLLPPIARVASDDEDLAVSSPDDQRPISQDSRPAPGRNGGETGFLGGVALHKYRKSIQQQGGSRPGAGEISLGSSNTSSALPESHLARAKPPPPPPPINTDFARPAAVPVAQRTKPSSFVTPTDRQQFSADLSGRRPSGTRMATEPAMLAAAVPAQEAHKGKKALPFLKNPMSTLLLRRKTGQNIPDNMTLTLNEEPIVDPRIRGTRVHDFSAPRPRRVTPTVDTNVGGVGKEAGSDLERSQILSPESAVSVSSLSQLPAQLDSSWEAPSDHKRSTSDSSTISKSSVQAIRRLSRDKPLPEYPGDRTQPAAYPVPPLPPVPPKDDNPVPLRSFPSTTSRAISVDTTALFKTESVRTTASVKTTTSVRSTSNRRISTLSRASTRASVMSSLPKHMKSTSSRFSFDMIGAAKQEKLLEERHRQREAEKQTTTVTNTGRRDSRFDDFDEDGFDYDAMMEDDVFEEAIPGVNVDLVEEEFEGDGDYDAADDPDNDQENFAGFVFQRSNPTSGLASPATPGMLMTPRDVNGKAIGFAMTKDTTPDLAPPASPMELATPTEQEEEEDVTSLGIQGLEANLDVAYNAENFQQNQQLPPISEDRRRGRGDDLYFDDGLADELDFEHEGPKFDESLFDLDDTDKYGRPLPGVFAEAQKQFIAKQEEASRRASDLTSRLSAQSQVSQSTAHTSISMGVPPAIPEKETEREAEEEAIGPTSPQHEVEQDLAKEEVPPPKMLALSGNDLAYQAALAEAAQKAAASGKFRRGSDPPIPTGVTITSPTDSAESVPHLQPDIRDFESRLEDYEDEPFSSNLDDYEDEPFASNLEDYEQDDDDFIAEANAEALANDSDGWYGQEFGFYAAPASQNHHGHTHHSSTSSTSSKTLTKPLNAENLFQYASGGYFGPSGSGLTYSASGRVVSREPNLTPITERSEYSNRNSIMSMALPPAIGGGGPGNEGHNSGILQSPGLAQLTMMEAEYQEGGGDMSLSALLKLRSRAWGGSQAGANNSLPSSRDGSPRSEQGAPGSPWGAGSGFLGPAAGHSRKNSAFSIWSNSDADGGRSGSGSPTLTVGILPPTSPVPPAPLSAVGNPTIGLAPAPVFTQTGAMQNSSPALNPGSCSPVLEDDEITLEDTEEHDDGSTTAATSALTSAVTEMSEMSLSGYVAVNSPVDIPEAPTSPVMAQKHAQHQKRPGMGHRHQGSSDSVSYMMEEEQGKPGGARWVMERRRTAESGEVEIVGRQVVEGGRI